MTTIISNLRKKWAPIPLHDKFLKKKKPQDCVLRLSFFVQMHASSGRGFGGRIKISAKPKAKSRKRAMHDALDITQMPRFANTRHFVLAPNRAVEITARWQDI